MVAGFTAIPKTEAIIQSKGRTHEMGDTPDAPSRKGELLQGISVTRHENGEIGEGRRPRRKIGRSF
jgi:hypothetical protein